MRSAIEYYLGMTFLRTKGGSSWRWRMSDFNFTIPWYISPSLVVCVCVCVCIQLLSCVRLFANLRTVAHQAPRSMGFSQQEYWSGLPCPPPGNLPNSGIELSLPHCRWILNHLSYQGSPFRVYSYFILFILRFSFCDKHGTIQFIYQVSATVIVVLHC